MAYATRIRQDAEGNFTAIVLYEDRPCPGLPMRFYASIKAAERGAALMLRNAA